MVDIVDEAVQNVVTVLKTIPAIKSSTVYLYDADQLITLKDKLLYPAVGVIYTGMVPVDSKGPTIKVELFVNIVIAGESLCDSDPLVNDLKPGVTSVLDAVRKALICTEMSPHYKWRFVAEQIEDFGNEEIIGFVQRWKVTTAITR